MSGIKALRRIQLGDEATTDPGTAVAATTVWRGMGTIQDDRTVTFVEEDVGILMPTDRTYIPKLGATLDFDEIEATFEQLPYILEASIGAASPTTDTGSGYIYTYNLPTASVPTIRTYTIEGGDNQEAEEMAYSYVESFSLSGAGGEAVKVTASWKGRTASTSTFTPSSDATIPEVEEILFSKGQLYIDASSDGFGTSSDLVSQTLLDFSLDYESGLVAKYAADGQLYFSFVQSTRPSLKLSLTFEHNATAVTEKDLWKLETVRRVQLRFNGSALTSGGAYTTKTLIINVIGKYETVDKLDEKDGNDILAFTMIGGYNVTEATAGNIIVVNELAALP